MRTLLAAAAVTAALILAAVTAPAGQPRRLPSCGLNHVLCSPPPPKCWPPWINPNDPGYPKPT